VPRRRGIDRGIKECTDPTVRPNNIGRLKGN